MSKRKLLSVLVGAASVLLLSTTASAYHLGETHHNGGGMGMGGGWFGFVMMFLWSLVLVAIVVGVLYWVFGQRKESESDATEILRERYARGEIDEEEFRERKRSLTEG